MKHSDFKTTQRYIDLAEVLFGAEVGKLSDWYGGGVGTKSWYQVPPFGAGSRSTSGVAAV